jgi:hypothetical protein
MQGIDKIRHLNPKTLYSLPIKSLWKMTKLFSPVHFPDRKVAYRKVGIRRDDATGWLTPYIQGHWAFLEGGLGFGLVIRDGRIGTDRLCVTASGGTTAE